MGVSIGRCMYSLVNRVLLHLRALILTSPLTCPLQTRIYRSECYLVKGRTKTNSCELNLLFFGDSQSLHYLIDLIFSEPYQTRSIGQMTLKKAISISQKIPSDIIFIESHGAFSKELSRSALILPHLIWILDIASPMETLISKMKRVRRNRIRVLQKANYTYEYTNDVKKFTFFYDKIYVPYVLKVHGKSAIIFSKERFINNFKNRGLFLVKSGDQYVSGISFKMKNYTVECELLGVVETDDKLAGQAALYGLIKWARENGFKLIDYGRTTPFASDGLYFYKRSWGMHIKPFHSLVFGMHVRNLSDGVIDFLSSNPFVFLCNGDLVIFTLHDSDYVDLKAMYCKYYSPGLNRLIVIHKVSNEKIQGMTLLDKRLEQLLTKHLRFEELRKKNYCAHVLVFGKINN